MGMFLIHRDSVCTEECTYDILSDCFRCIQGLYLEVFGSLYGWLDGLWIDQGPSREHATDGGAMSIASDHIDIEELYCMCTFLDVFGEHYLQEKTVGWPHKDCADFQLSTTQIWSNLERH